MNAIDRLYTTLEKALTKIELPFIFETINPGEGRECECIICESIEKRNNQLIFSNKTFDMSPFFIYTDNECAWDVENLSHLLIYGTHKSFDEVYARIRPL